MDRLIQRDARVRIAAGNGIAGELLWDAGKTKITALLRPLGGTHGGPSECERQTSVSLRHVSVKMRNLYGGKSLNANAQLVRWSIRRRKVSLG